MSPLIKDDNYIPQNFMLTLFLKNKKTVQSNCLLPLLQNFTFSTNLPIQKSMILLLLNKYCQFEFYKKTKQLQQD